MKPHRDTVLTPQWPDGELQPLCPSTLNHFEILHFGKPMFAFTLDYLSQLCSTCSGIYSFFFVRERIAFLAKSRSKKNMLNIAARFRSETFFYSLFAPAAGVLCSSSSFHLHLLARRLGCTNTPRAALSDGTFPEAGGHSQDSRLARRVGGDQITADVRCE